MDRFKAESPCALISSRMSQTHDVWPSTRKCRLAVAELALRIVVPCLSLLIWLMWDDELRASLLASQARDQDVEYNPVFDLVTIDDQTVLSVHSHGQLRGWDLERRSVTFEIQSHLTDVRCASYTSQGGLIAVGSATGDAEVWSLDQPYAPLARTDDHNLAVNVCKFSKDGKHLYCAGESTQVLVYESRTLRRVATLEAASPIGAIRSLAITLDGARLLAGDREGRVHLWNLSDHSLIHSFDVVTATDRSKAKSAMMNVEAILVLPDSRNFVAMSRCYGFTVWDMESGAMINSWSGGNGRFKAAILADDGQRIMACNELSEVRIWNSATGSSMGCMTSDMPLLRTLAADRAGATIITGDLTGRIRIQDLP